MALCVERLEDRLVPASSFIGIDGHDSSTPGVKFAQPVTGDPVRITYDLGNLIDGGLGGSATQPQITEAIDEALSLWAKAAPLDFVQVPSGTGEIHLQHVPLSSDPTLAGDLAYTFPVYGDPQTSTVDFVAGKNWENDPRQGYDLIQIATHEIGHALGLAHEPVAAGDSIMHPIYAGRYSGPGTGFLFADDVAGIEAIYGAGSGSVTTLDGLFVVPSPAPPAAPPAPPAPVSPQVQFVRHLFQTILHRAPTAGDEALYSQLPQSVAALGVYQSEEARTVRLGEYYRIILGREIDPEGLAGWLAAERAGASEQTIALALLSSPEFHARR